ncbi:sensor domain-containing diguanylate cyclase [Clostridium massiliamazoniense]|uniref:sensor domain-containing diguanylate cyclase n=1 Tax=Clostridium massiliamazoniense TaxID=1347366 RepID=UPI0006D795B0|nr:sensor domain-containing diguanylate cyclase [Clostridium massiliamazoniense]
MDYKELYEGLNEEFKSYRKFVESKLLELKESNYQLERNLSIFANIVEMGRYISLYIFDDKLLEKINDSIIGVLGVNYSTIHIFNGFSLEAKVSNCKRIEDVKIHYELKLLKDRKTFIINEQEKIFKSDKNRDEVHSLIAVPIIANESFIGYIVVEHKYYGFFQTKDIKFLEHISNQVTMALTNRNLYKKVQEAAKKDVLLDIYNRKYFYEVFTEIARTKSKKCFALVMGDIDNFKKINDNYGHLVGDYALKHVIGIMNFNLNDKDVIARYGGEEIIMLVENKQDKVEIMKKIEHIRNDIERFPLRLVDGRVVKITMSFGVAFVEEITDNMDIDHIIKIADENLYRAKANGKNRVEF